MLPGRGWSDSAAALMAGAAAPRGSDCARRGTGSRCEGAERSEPSGGCRSGTAVRELSESGTSLRDARCNSYARGTDLGCHGVRRSRRRDDLDAGAASGNTGRHSRSCRRRCLGLGNHSGLKRYG